MNTRAVTRRDGTGVPPQSAPKSLEGLADGTVYVSPVLLFTRALGSANHFRKCRIFKVAYLSRSAATIAR